MDGFVRLRRLDRSLDEGDRLEVTIEDVGSEGDGIAKVEGYTLFVSGAETGDQIEVRVDDVKPNFGFAQPIGE